MEGVPGLEIHRPTSQEAVCSQTVAQRMAECQTQYALSVDLRDNSAANSSDMEIAALEFIEPSTSDDESLQSGVVRQNTLNLRPLSVDERIGRSLCYHAEQTFGVNPK